MRVSKMICKANSSNRVEEGFLPAVPPLVTPAANVSEVLVLVS